jgi:hypothetical protein
MWDLDLNAAVAERNGAARTHIDSMGSIDVPARILRRTGLASATYIAAGRFTPAPAARPRCTKQFKKRP